MHIKSFKYKQHSWELDSIYFNLLNLIVGKNAVGKSKTLKALLEVAKFIKGESANDASAHKCCMVFADADGKELQYSYEWSGNAVIAESMSFDNRMVISRDKNQAVLNEDTINPPVNKLIIQTQRDTNKFPEFETVIGWAEHTRVFSFSDLTSFNSFIIPNMYTESIEFDDVYERIDDNKETFVLNTMRELGYKISGITKLELTPHKIIYLNEEGVTASLFPHSLSNGMVRVFYILTYLAYIAMVEGAKTFLVDDLGEGLDFSRSSKLSKIMFDYCESNDIQLIVTSNDNFLMNAVDLNNWIILQRKGNKVTSYSQITHSDMFIKFRKMGLNNFDMLSTDFVDRFISDAK
jgi:AAA15 family ATPase/GTPase